MQKTKLETKLEQFNKVYKKHDKLKTGNKLNNNQNHPDQNKLTCFIYSEENYSTLCESQERTPILS
jgi:SPX domain protein involved in polyphosphate accumulation